MTQIIKNIVTDYGAVGDGATSCLAAFDAFRDDARAAGDAILTIPAGTYYLNEGLPFDGQMTLVVNGVGNPTIIGAMACLGSFSGVSQKIHRAAYLENCYKGATSVFCKAPSEADYFDVGMYLLIGSQEYQGYSGYPPNCQKVQFVKVLATNGSTGEIQITPALKENHFDHFINTGIYLGSSGLVGGPVTAYLMIDPENGSGAQPTSWDSDITVNGITFNTNNFGSGHQMYCKGRRIVLNNCTFIDCSPIPTCAQYVQFNNVDTTAGLQIELDKLVEYFECNDCHFHAFIAQSASGSMKAVFNNCITDTFWTGTPRNMEMYGGSVPGITIGVHGYGTTDSVLIDGTNLNGGLGWESSTRDISTRFTLEDGYLTYIGPGILPFLAEDSAVLIAGTMSSNFDHVGLTKRIGQVFDNGLGQPKHKTQLSTLNPPFLTGDTYVVQHPCTDVTLRNLGSNSPYGDGPAHKPLYSYGSQTRTFEGGGGFTLWGTLEEIRVNVTRRYTGAQPNCILHLGGQFGNVPIIHPDGVSGGFDFDWVIDCTQAGERIITPTTVTGALGNDTTTPPGAVWFISYINPKITTDISGDTELQKPMITITAKTDQGLVPITTITRPLLNKTLHA